MNSYYLRPTPVLAPAVTRSRDAAERDEGFMQSLISSLSKPTEVECTECHGSGLLSLRGICERCMGRGQILSR